MTETNAIAASYSSAWSGARRCTSAARSSRVAPSGCQHPTLTPYPVSARNKVRVWSSDPIRPTVRAWRGKDTRAFPEAQR